MKNILEELFDGNIYPDELIIPQDPEYRPLNQKISDTIGLWKKKLSEEDYKQLEDLLNLRSQSDSMHAAASFITTRSKLVWLKDNEPSTYAELALGGKMQQFLDCIGKTHHQIENKVKEQLIPKFGENIAGQTTREFMTYDSKSDYKIAMLDARNSHGVHFVLCSFFSEVL